MLQFISIDFKKAMNCIKKDEWKICVSWWMGEIFRHWYLVKCVSKAILCHNLNQICIVMISTKHLHSQYLIHSPPKLNVVLFTKWCVYNYDDEKNWKTFLWPPRLVTIVGWFFEFLNSSYLNILKSKSSWFRFFEKSKSKFKKLNFNYFKNLTKSMVFISWKNQWLFS
jgi:hypothetical protein